MITDKSGILAQDNEMKYSRNFSRRGQSLVEFALALTLMLTLLAGAVDLGSAFFSYVALRDAAQEGALYGSIAAIVDTNANGKYDPGENLNTAAIEARVRQSSTQPVDLTDASKVTISITATTPYCAGNAITVTVAYNYQLTMPLIGAVIGSQTIPVSASVTNTILKPACP
jgi:Flp pilus assembly protein TadG